MRKTLERISSENKQKSIDIVKSPNGGFELVHYIKKYDLEEDKYYEIREFPGPTGTYGDLNSAIAEAKRLVEL
ncbi:hypothetical protein HT094_15150 [Shewanella sp. ZOR0012]|uniref:hypothetical protein n=1 Tax=Shewanella TaxID=22 RepID=UPI0006461616|nr:hypothetical protein [Shewanella sp. ZOR0012]NSM25524.1 hypothetical protein [Shewanella sp. ZOR0012]